MSVLSDTNLDLGEAYASMRLIRRFERTAQEQFEQGNVPGPLHLSIGQEAVAVGTCSQLRTSDSITSTHRGHHHVLAKGARPDLLMAELLGRAPGYSRGRGGSMHVAIPALGILGTNGIVGGGIPIATGAAYGAQVHGTDDVTVCFFGEGAAATGGFGEALNIAGLWKLPIVFVCENNQFVEMTPQSVHVSGRIWKRAEGYDLPGHEIDGNRVDEVSAAVADAVERARSGGGPTLIEAVTYRWYGHFAGDKALFRDEEEVMQWREQRDPLLHTRNDIGDELADQMDSRVEGEIATALAFALSSPTAPEESLMLDHYGPS